MKANLVVALKRAVERVIGTTAGRIVMSTILATGMASLAYAQDFFSACYDPGSGNWFVTDTYCNDPSYQCLQWADQVCTCNYWGNCWVQSWQCSSCSS